MNWLRTRQKTALSIYCVIGVINIMLGIRYFSSAEFMSYHAEAIGSSWSGLEIGVQRIILALMKVAGAGWFAFGIFTIVMAVSAYKTGGTLLRWALPIGTIIFHSGTFVATWAVFQDTGAPTPWLQSLVGIGFSLLAWVMDAPWSSRVRETS